MFHRQTDIRVEEAVVVNTTATTSIAVPRPSGTVNGSLVVGLIVASTTASLGAPGGQGFTGGTTLGIGCWYKFITNVAADQTTWTFGAGASTNLSMTMYRIEGCDPTTPVIDILRNSGTNTGGGGVPTGPAVTATKDGQSLLTLFQAVNSAAATSSPPNPAAMSFDTVFEDSSVRTRAAALGRMPKGLVTPGAWGMASCNYGAVSLCLNPTFK